MRGLKTGKVYNAQISLSNTGLRSELKEHLYDTRWGTSYLSLTDWARERFSSSQLLFNAMLVTVGWSTAKQREGETENNPVRVLCVCVLRRS